MATNKDKKSANQETLISDWKGKRAITKIKNRRKLLDYSANQTDLLIQSLNAIHQSPDPSAFNCAYSCCKCSMLTPPNKATRCKYCISLEADPTIGLPKGFVVKHCRKCGNYYTVVGRANCRARIQSTELLNFFTKMLEPWLCRRRLVVVDAQFLHTGPLSERINISLNLQRVTTSGENFERSWTVEYLVKVHECLSCLLNGLPDLQSSIVELRPYGSSNTQSLFYLERLILIKVPALQFKDFRRSSKGIDYFFSEERDADYFVTQISNITPIKPNKLKKILLSGSPSNKTKNYHTCRPVLICPIRRNCLVFLPSKVSAKLGNIGPLVICTAVSSSITMLDPFKLRVCSLTADQYWTEPFEPLKLRNELVEFIVLNVEVVSKGPNYSLADIEVARISDFGKNNLIFLVKSHLGEQLKPGDHALGYVLNWDNISHVEVEKYRGLLPDLVLVRQTWAHQRRVRNVVNKNAKSQEYLEFLGNLEKNPEAMFNLSLKCAEDDETGAVDMDSVGKGKSVDFNLEDMLADLGLSDEEDGDANKKE